MGTIKLVTLLDGTRVTDFWYHGGYSRFYGHHNVSTCVAFAEHRLPWPMLGRRG